MRELHRDSYVTLAYDAASAIVWMTRSAEPFESVAALRRSHNSIPELLDGLGRHDKRLLVDVRLAPPRNDAPFEEALRTIRNRITRGFVRVAVLTQTVVGQLQVKRQAREAEEEFGVFASEKDAVAYLRAGVDPHKIPAKQAP